ncbi:MAG TPA: hypothetical protein VEI97_20580 [bacterium]|nr:hypothetical protein [bacterium]
MRRLALLPFALLAFAFPSTACQPKPPADDDANRAQRESGIVGGAPAAETGEGADAAEPDTATAPEQPAAEPASTPANQPAQPSAFDPLQVTITGDPQGRQVAKPGDTVPMGVQLCNTGTAPLNNYQLRVIVPSMATLQETEYAEFKTLEPLPPSDGDCKANGRTLDFHIKLGDNVQAGTSFNVKPVVVVMAGSEVRTFEAPFNYTIRG